MSLPTLPEADQPIACSWASQSLTLNYWDWGNDSAPPLLLLHGSGDHARSWDWTARALREDWRVIAPDFRGHGDSQWSPDGAYLTSYHVIDIANLIDALGADKITLIAHSYGGAVALRYAALFSERVTKIVNVDGMGPSPHHIELWRGEGAVERNRQWIARRHELRARPPRCLASIEEGAARMRQQSARLSEAGAYHLALHGLRRDGAGYVWKRDPLGNIFSVEDFALEDPSIWTHVAAPTLLLYGPEDNVRTDPAEDGRAQHLRDWRSVRFEDAGHWLHHDQFDKFIAAVREFL